MSTSPLATKRLLGGSLLGDAMLLADLGPGRAPLRAWSTKCPITWSEISPMCSVSKARRRRGVERVAVGVLGFDELMRLSS